MILLTPDSEMATRVAQPLSASWPRCPRAETARGALSTSRIIVARDIAQCVEISTSTVRAPDYSDPRPRTGRRHYQRRFGISRRLVAGVRRDYASGTNHVLPTYGYTPPAPASAWRIFETHDRAGAVARRFAALASRLRFWPPPSVWTPTKTPLRCASQPLKEQA